MINPKTGLTSNFLQVNGNSALASLSGSLLGTISVITESVACIEVEQEKFIEIGCYFYRISPAIMELQTTENTPKNAKEILTSLSQSINLAKELVENCQKGKQHVSDTELRSIIAQLERAVKDMGECLCLIPSSTFQGEEYAEIVVRSLSDEMQNVHFEVRQPQELESRMISVVELPKKEFTPIESDLYSITVEVSKENSQVLSMPFDIPKRTSQSSQRKSGSTKYLTELSQVAQYIEPLYETFSCPLTNEIMEDPVTIETGITYERKAITEWFEACENPEDIRCPTSGKKLTTRALSTNVALRTTIDEWKERNEAARIKVARAALSLASSDSMVKEALRDLHSICQIKPYNKIQVCDAGILPLLVQFLEHKDGHIRCAVLELLRQLAEEDEAKEMIGQILDISTLIKMISSTLQAVRHATLLFLLELSRSQVLGEKIGSAAGAILMLIRIRYNRNTDPFASEKADEILKNLEKCPDNIKRMAENGFLEPLLNHLIEGCEEMQMEMASCLGEIILGHDSKTYVAERASPCLIKMVQSGNTLIRRAAFQALAEISSYHPNARILVEAGIVHIMAEEMFIRTIYNEPMNSKKEAAAILANILESGIDHGILQVNTQGHPVDSDYVVYGIIYMLKNSTPDELNINLIRILLCLTESPKSMTTVVSVIKETEACFTLVEIVNNPHEELGVAVIKLLIKLSPYVGHTLAERLCKTRGLPENLIEIPTQTNQYITEKQALSAKLLAKIPHQNLALNLALLGKNIVPGVLQTINLIQKTGTRSSRYANAYLEGLVGILVRFTTTLYETQILFLARNHNFTQVFTELLVKTSSDEVQKLSAIGLENLSSESIHLSKPPQLKRKKFMKLFYLPKSLSFGSSKKKKIPLCTVHRGVCSSQSTFCLVDAKAVERLLACVDHENAEVVEAALAAICTLLDDKVDVDNSVSLLSEVHAVKHVLNAVKEHKQEGLWQKSFWVIEKFLVKGGDQSASDISQDRLFPATLISAFHHGDGSTRQMAEKILRHLNKMPNVSTTAYYST
ncbi:hypothetical protein SLE2022_219960 [Rubroshorea leprosula]